MLTVLVRTPDMKKMSQFPPTVMLPPVTATQGLRETRVIVARILAPFPTKTLLSD